MKSESEQIESPPLGDQKNALPTPSSSAGACSPQILETAKSIQLIRDRQPKRAEPTSVAASVAAMRGLTISQLSAALTSPAIRQRTHEDGRRFVAEHEDYYESPEPPRDLREPFWRGCGIDKRTREVIDSGYLYDRQTAFAWWTEFDRLYARLGTGLLVCLVGRFGCGKTIMAGLLIKAVCMGGGWKPKYFSAAQIFRMLLSARNEGKTEQEVLDEFMSYALLVIDEADQRSNNAYDDQRLREIVNVRYGRQLDTLLISNLSAQEFAKSVGGAVIDRARQCGGIIVCNWPSFRKAGVT